MHPKSFVSNFWGAVHPRRSGLFLFHFFATHRTHRHKRKNFAEMWKTENRDKKADVC